jgi:hypothetical protein
MSQSLLSNSSSSFNSLHAGGQHVACRPKDPGTLIGLMSRIWDVEYACDVRKPTPAMALVLAFVRTEHDTGVVEVNCKS